MTKEEIFKKNFPEYCTKKGECLSPYYDVFDAGVEITTAELNKGIIQSLIKENAGLKARLNAINLLTSELEKQSKAGRPKWHKVADGDFPKEDTEVLNNDGVKVILMNGHWRYVYGDEWEDDAHLEHWCEIPKFEE